MKKREYETYENYLSHQMEKTLDPTRRRLLIENFEARASHFEARFRTLREYIKTNLTQDTLRRGALALCLGARIGEEVAALKNLGMQAIGVDLVPHPPLVEAGDFNNLKYEDSTFELVFSNAIDHTNDIKKFLYEVERVLTDGGYFILDTWPGAYGKYEAVEILDPYKDILPDRPTGLEFKGHLVLITHDQSTGVRSHYDYRDGMTLLFEAKKETNEYAKRVGI